MCLIGGVHLLLPAEIYRTLPVREELLRAVLGADLIGFHTYDYARHFISSCTRILGEVGGGAAAAAVAVAFSARRGAAAAAVAVAPSS